MVTGHRSWTDVLSSSEAGGGFSDGATRDANGRHTFSHQETRDRHRSAILRVSRPPSAPGPTRAEHQSTGPGDEFRRGPVTRLGLRGQIVVGPPSLAASTLGRCFSAVLVRDRLGRRSGRSGSPGRPARRGNGILGLASEHGQDGATVALELRRTDTGDLRQLAERAWLGVGDRVQHVVVEDDVGGNAVLARTLEPPGPEALAGRRPGAPVPRRPRLPGSLRVPELGQEPRAVPRPAEPEPALARVIPT